MERKPDLRPVAACVVGGLMTVAAAVFARRIAVGPLRDLPAGEAAAYAAAFVLAGAAAARQLLNGCGPRAARGGDAGVLLLGIMLVAGLTTSPAAVLACVVAAVTVVGLLALPEVVGGSAAAVGRRVPETAAAGPESVVETQGVTGLRSHAERGNEERRTSPESDADGPGQKLRLLRVVRDGREVVEGEMRFEIPAGDGAHTLHVPLWPPLAGEPAVTCELHEIDGRVQVPVTKPYGLRIEVRVPEPVDEPLAGVVRFVAECSAGAVAA